MLQFFLKSKVHRATVTQAELHYEGSLTLDVALMEAAKLQPYEKILVVNVQNGQRFETYVIEGERGTGVVCLNGPAARLGLKGDTVVIMSFCMLTPEEAANHQPCNILLDGDNKVISNNVR
jgi:aspartate 1-decarboxylase